MRWAFFSANGTALDELFNELVRLRHAIAGKLGDASFTALGYRRMRRLDYGTQEVARFREQVAEQVVPLVGHLLAERRATFGWDRLQAWDEPIVDPRGNADPVGDSDRLLDGARAMFDEMDPRLGQFYRLMAEGGFLDMENRPGEGGGGFCTVFPTHGVPFIFGSFNGTHHGVGLLVHEMGHAFQCWASRDLPSLDCLWPTSEASEIHSMALEFLTYPWMALLFGDGAERYRRTHLIEALAFLPYGVAVDHFQHLVYADPTATATERHAMWRAMERRYLPWRDWGDLAYPARGGQWQAQLHVYRLPFYFIDYALAQCCALQMWARSLSDRQATLEAYVALCRRGGSAPFQDLVRSADLAVPFADGALSDVVDVASRQLAA